MTQSPVLEFGSSAFAVAPGEDEETNPGRAESFLNLREEA
jgi:hypothetical protein